jgi:hypothetical protein
MSNTQAVTASVLADVHEIEQLLYRDAIAMARRRRGREHDAGTARPLARGTAIVGAILRRRWETQ